MMWFQLTEKEQLLFDRLISIPPDFNGAAKLLQTQNFTSDEVTRVAIRYADECFCEAGDFVESKKIPHPKEVIPNLHSTYIVDVIGFLLQYGLDPNGIYDECNIMQCLRYVDNEFLAADTLALLFEHGGNYELNISGVPFFCDLDFDVFFDAVEQEYRPRYKSLVHCWMVTIGYGARCPEGTMQFFKEYDESGVKAVFDPSKLKNHRNYYFGLTHLEDDFSISIYDKETLWEVVRVK